MGQYDAVAQRALAAITRKGGPVTFAVQTSAPIYDPATDTWSGGTTSSITGRGVQIPDNPEQILRLQGQGFTLTDPITLMVAASGLGVVPTSGMTMTWGNNVAYAIRSVEAINPDGTSPILYTIIGSRG